MAALRTNFALVGVDDAMFDVGTLAPYGEERHRELEETRGAGLLARPGHTNGVPIVTAREVLLHAKVELIHERELQPRESVPGGGSYAAKLSGWVEVSAN